MEQSTLPTNSHSTVQEIPHLLWNPKVHYHADKGPWDNEADFKMFNLSDFKSRHFWILCKFWSSGGVTSCNDVVRYHYSEGHAASIIRVK